MPGYVSIRLYDHITFTIPQNKQIGELIISELKISSIII